MFFAKDLSELKDGFLSTLRDADAETYSGVARDRMTFFLWELKLLESFLGLQSFVFAGECGMLDIMLKMQEIWKRLCDTLSVPVADSDADTEAYAETDAYAYWKEFILKMQEIWKRLCDTLSVPVADSDADTEAYAETDAYAYWKEFIESPRRDEFIDPNTDPFPFHVPTEIWKTKLEFRSKYSFPEIPLSANKVDNDIPTPDFVMEFINVVVEYLSVLVQISDPCSLLYIPGPKKIIEDALKELKLLGFFSCFVSNKHIEPQSRHTFFTYALIEASHTAMVAWLHLPIYGNRYQDPSEVNYLLSDILEMKIRPIQPGLHKIYIDVLQALKLTMQPARWYSNIQNKHGADSVSVENPAHNLMELPTICNPSQIVGLIDQMTILQDMLCLLRANLIHLPILDLEFHLQDMEAVIVDAGLLVYSLYDIRGEKEDTTLEGVNRALGFDLPSNTESIKAMVYLIIRKAFQSNLPRIQGLGYVDLLLKNLKEFQGRYSDSLAFLKNQLQIIQKELESLLPFLEVVVEEPHNKLKSTLHEDCATQLISKAYEVEYVVDACINKGVPYWCLERWLLDIIKEITSIKAEIQGKNMVEDTMKTVTARTSSHLARTPRINEEIVGFEDVIENLRNKLLNGTKGQDVISIHGMPGLGKTTLANRLYSDRLVVSQFDICAQCCVSQVYSYKDLLLALLRDAIGEG